MCFLCPTMEIVTGTAFAFQEACFVSSGIRSTIANILVDVADS